jgi:hypothetical protein
LLESKLKRAKTTANTENATQPTQIGVAQPRMKFGQHDTAASRPRNLPSQRSILHSPVLDASPVLQYYCNAVYHEEQVNADDWSAEGDRPPSPPTPPSNHEHDSNYVPSEEAELIAMTPRMPTRGNPSIAPFDEDASKQHVPSSVQDDESGEEQRKPAALTFFPAPVQELSIDDQSMTTAINATNSVMDALELLELQAAALLKTKSVKTAPVLMVLLPVTSRKTPPNPSQAPTPTVANAPTVQVPAPAMQQVSNVKKVEKKVTSVTDRSR